MRTVIQWIIGLAIVAFGLNMLNVGYGLRIALAVIVFGVLVMLNTGRKKKEDEEEEDDW